MNLNYTPKQYMRCPKFIPFRFPQTKSVILIKGIKKDVMLERKGITYMKKERKKIYSLHIIFYHFSLGHRKQEEMKIV
jgi:hypothetical protein